MKQRQRELRAGIRAAIRTRKMVKAMEKTPDAFTDEQMQEAREAMMCRHVKVK